jgi:hypothetical protein
MKIYRQSPVFMAILALTLALILGSCFAGVAQAASEDVAMFYDDLSQHGDWVEYERYGPVWRPGQVAEDWRPYTNGRWVPTNDGYVFESQEPWAWATYHYGNWMPTQGHGWVWVPGRTWYPSTVEWRTSPESASPDDSYVGWAPIPPPNYVPPPAYAPPSYNQGSPIVDLLTAPFWIFAKAASFLLGFGEPYTPSYSYMNSGVLVPPSYVQVFYPQTVIVRSYYTPNYYPLAYFGGRGPRFAAYNWGPPARYVTRVTNINQTVFNRTINYNSVNINRIHNVVAPRAVINRHAYVRQIIPPALAQGHQLPRSKPVQDFRRAQANLYKPDFLPPPREVPRIKAQFPRLTPVAVTPGHGIPGMALPPRATMPLSPQMERQIQNLPPQQRFVPAGAHPTPPPTATQREPVQRKPVEPLKPGPGVQTQPSPNPPAPTRREEFQPRPGRPGPPPVGTFTPPGAAKPGVVPPPQGPRGLTQEQRHQVLQQQRLPHGGVPRQPQPAQQQLQQERLRQQQIQQQQRQQQERLRQQQLQQQQERFRPQPQQQQIREQQMHQERLRQQQIQPRQQPQVQPRLQVQPQPQPRPQPQAPPRVQPQPQPRPQPQPQQQQQRQRPERGQQQKKPPEQ